MIRVGDALELSCRVNDCPGKVNFTWNTVVDRVRGGAAKDNETVSRLLFSNISTEQSNNIVCKALCGGKTREKTSAVQVYCEYSVRFF